jgi:cytochrome P450
MASAILEMAAPGWLVQYVAELLSITLDHAKLAVYALETASMGAFLWKIFGKKKYNLPPGPTPLPLIGNLHQMKYRGQLYLEYADLKKKYGDIVTHHIGPMRMVILNDAEVTRDLLLRQGNYTSNRPYIRMLEQFSGGGQDIVFADPSIRWKIQRKLAHSALRKFASGEALENILESVFETLDEHIQNVGHIDVFNTTFHVAYNIIASMSFGKKFKFEDPYLQKMININKEAEGNFSFVDLTQILPSLKFIPTRASKIMDRAMSLITNMLDETWKSHQTSFDKDHLTDFTYHLINAIQEADMDPDDSKAIKLLEPRHYWYILNDLFIAGTETTRHTLTWIWLYLAAFPEVQKKAQAEVDAVIGRDGRVSARAREQLPYVDAVLHEVMRIRPVVPTGVMHLTTQDIKAGKYDIPKGTTLVQNTWSIHFDPKHWHDPEAFLPGRWLDNQGKYVFQQSGFMPFQVGKRSCVGEGFAKLELHILTTMMLQKHTLVPMPGHQVRLNIKEDNFIIPHKQNLMAIPRK